MLRDLLEAQADSIRAVQLQSQTRAAKLALDTLRQVKKDLAGMSLGSWGYAERLAVMRQLQAGVSQLTKGQTDLLALGLAETARVSARDASTWLHALDRQYLGVARPLRFESLGWIDNQANQLSKIRLRTYAQSFARYGSGTVTKIEDEIAKTILTGESWIKARPKVMAAVKDVVGDRQWMVDRIIRTETSAAYNGLQLNALIEEDTDDEPMLKRLVATFDSRTGRDSVGLHGQTKPVKEPFYDPFFGVSYQAPPNRPHDREIVVGWRASYGDEFEDGDKGYIVDTATPTEDAPITIPGASAARAEGPTEIRKAMLSANLIDYRKKLQAAKKGAASLVTPAAQQAAIQQVEALMARINAIKAEVDEIDRIQALLAAKKATIQNKIAQKKAKEAAEKAKAAKAAKLKEAKAKEEAAKAKLLAEKKAAEAAAAEKAKKIAQAKALARKASKEQAAALEAAKVKKSLDSSKAVISPKPGSVSPEDWKAQAKQEWKSAKKTTKKFDDLKPGDIIATESGFPMTVESFPKAGKIRVRLISGKSLEADPKVAKLAKSPAGNIYVYSSPRVWKKPPVIKLRDKDLAKKLYRESSEIAESNVGASIKEVLSASTLADPSKINAARVKLENFVTKYEPLGTLSGKTLDEAKKSLKLAIKQTDEIKVLTSKGFARTPVADIEAGDLVRLNGAEVAVKEFDPSSVKIQLIGESGEISSLTWKLEGANVSGVPDFIYRKKPPKLTTAQAKAKAKALVEEAIEDGTSAGFTAKKAEIQKVLTEAGFSLQGKKAKAILEELDDAAKKVGGGAKKLADDAIASGDLAKMQAAKLEAPIAATSADEAAAALDKLEDATDAVVDAAAADAAVAAESYADIVGAEKILSSDLAKALEVKPYAINNAIYAEKLKATKIPNPKKAGAFTYEIEAQDLAKWLQTETGKVSKGDKFKTLLAKAQKAEESAKKAGAAKAAKETEAKALAKLFPAELKTSEAAKLFEVKSYVLNNAVYAGKLPAKKVGKSLVVTRDDLADWLTKHAAKTKQAKSVPALAKYIDDVSAIKAKKVATAIAPDAADVAKAVAKKKATKKKATKKKAAKKKPEEPTKIPADVVDVDDTAKWKKVGAQGGSNDGGMYESTTGERWYVKTPSVEDVARNEVLAAQLYRAAGVDIPDVVLATRKGKPSIASKIIDGVGEDAAALKSGKLEGIAEEFVVDAWLANWDVVGLGYDNLLVKGSKAYRLDTGGALRYRAQGGKKNDLIPGVWGDEVKELDTLLDPKIAPQASSVFSKYVTDKSIAHGIDRVLDIDEATIKALVKKVGPIDAKEGEELLKTLLNRREYLRKLRDSKYANIPGKLAKKATKKKAAKKTKAVIPEKSLEDIEKAAKKAKTTPESLGIPEKDYGDMGLTGFERQSADHVANEVLTRELYRIADIDAADVTLSDNAKRAVYDFREGTEINASAIKGDLAKQVADGFVVDAWLANWTGPSKLRKLANGKIIRGDMKGALRYRGGGDAKGGAFGDTVTELDNFLDSAKNPAAADVYKGVDAEAVVAGIDRVASITDAQITKVVDLLGPEDLVERSALRDKLIKRRDNIKSRRAEFVKKIKEEKKAKAAAAKKAKKEAAERKARAAAARKEIEEILKGGRAPFSPKVWDKIPDEQKEKVLRSYVQSTKAMEDLKSPLASPSTDLGFDRASLLSDTARKKAASESRTVFMKTYPDFYSEIMEKASSSWSGSSTGGAADIFHWMAHRLGLSQDSNVSARVRLTGKRKFGSYEVDFGTGEIKSSYSGKYLGNLEDVAAAFYGHTQAVLKAQGVTKVRAYRGLHFGDLANEIKNKSARKFVIKQDAACSWSDSPFSADAFSGSVSIEGRSRSVITTREADVGEILADRRASPFSIGLNGENEYILAGENRRVVSYATLDNLGAAHLGTGVSRRSGYDAVLLDVEDISEKPRSVAASIKSLENDAPYTILPGSAKPDKTVGVTVSPKRVDE